MFKNLLPVLLAMAALPAGATTVFTSYASMTAANPTLSFNTIDLTPLLSLADNATYTLDGVTFTAGSGTLADASSPWGSGIVLRTNSSPGTITIQLAPSVTAFGAMFGMIGSSFTTVNLSGSGIDENAFLNTANPVFWGAVSSTSFTTITFDASNKAVALNNFVYSTSPLDGGGGGGEVPEPSTLALIGSGLIALPLLSRRKHRS
jgi:hypothetical protein